MTGTHHAYFVIIWGTEEPKEIKRFMDSDTAWKYVAEHNIDQYVVYKGECIIDKT